MKNIFLQLKNKVAIKKEPLKKMLEIDENEEEDIPLIQNYFEEQDHTDEENITFMLKLIAHFTQPEIKQKLFALLVFFVARQSYPVAMTSLQLILKSNQSIISKVRFFSFTYKSTVDIELKKWLIIASINLIEQESKISMFSNFIQNFDLLLSELTFKENEYVQIFLKLINYLEKHLIYKKLWKHYIVQCLLKISQSNAQSAEVDALFSKLLNSNEVTQETISLIFARNLKTNKFFPYLQLLVLGNYEQINTLNIELLTSVGVKIKDFERKVKIQAIPRILSGIQTASYSQVAEILNINKQEVESYIIQAIQQGLLKAKIDEFQQTIIINNLRFRVLRPEERANLQKNISTFAAQLQQIAAK